MDEIIHNPRASRDLATVSWRPGRNMPRGGSSNGYYYESNYGRFSYVYLIDNGIDTTLSVRYPNGGDDFLTEPGFRTFKAKLWSGTLCLP